MADNLLQVQGASKSFGTRILFESASFSINEGEHVGVIGPNGAGKTTLFKILSGLDSFDSGEIVKSRKLRLGYLSQHDNWEPDETVEQHIQKGATLPLWTLKTLGLGLGLSQDLYTRPIASLSGGYRMRAKLLRLLGQEPNLMLLDEPTNYLDLETLLVLERFLASYEGAFLLISHDREFLRKTTDHTLEVEAAELTKYNGNIDDYFEQKQLLRDQLEARALSVAEKRAKILDFVNRFGAKASRARQAQSRLKTLEKLETVELKPLQVSARIRIPEPSPSSKLLFKAEGVELGYPEKTVISSLNFELSKGEHLAVVGLNGAGKSTLLKTLAGSLAPKRGQIQRGFDLKIAFYAQHVSEALRANFSVLEELQDKAHPDVKPQEILDLAGSLLFSGDDIHKKVGVLSGGEKSRVALGQVLLQKASCLILDEPTNHLDFQTVEALTQALENYAGAFIVVSHDRGFVGRVAKKILEIQSGQARAYPGTYDEYVWSLEKGAYATLQSVRGSSKSAEAQSVAQDSSVIHKQAFKESRHRLENQIKTAQKSILSAEKKLARIQEDLNQVNDLLTKETQASELQKLVASLAALQKENESLEAFWLEQQEVLETAEAELKSLLGS